MKALMLIWMKKTMRISGLPLMGIILKEMTTVVWTARMESLKFAELITASYSVKTKIIAREDSSTMLLIMKTSRVKVRMLFKASNLKD